MKPEPNRVLHWHMGTPDVRVACVVPDASIHITIQRTVVCASPRAVVYQGWHGDQKIQYAQFTKLHPCKVACERYVAQIGV